MILSLIAITLLSLIDKDTPVCPYCFTALETDENGSFYCPLDMCLMEEVL